MGICRFFRNLKENIMSMLEYSATGQFGALEVEGPIFKRDISDKEKPNLYVGKITPDSMFDWEVVEIVDDKNIKIKVLKIYHDRMDRYLDEGKVYPAFKHSGWNDATMQIWEIAPEHMKRDVSQVILMWDKGVGWSWDLDM